jgi:hypothetical protein
MDEAAEVICPWCGEPSFLSLEPGDAEEEFVQDCPVCCRPWQVRIHRGPEGELQVSVLPEGE